MAIGTEMAYHDRSPYTSHRRMHSGKPCPLSGLRSSQFARDSSSEDGTYRLEKANVRERGRCSVLDVTRPTQFVWTTVTAQVLAVWVHLLHSPIQ